jgi:hypothetical protein
MKQGLLTLVLLLGWAALPGCEKEEESRCPQLVSFTVTCYEQVVGRSPSTDEVNGWRRSCEDNAHSDSCLDCAMEQSCDDYLLNPDYVYENLCALRCP